MNGFISIFFFLIPALIVVAVVSGIIGASKYNLAGNQKPMNPNAPQVKKKRSLLDSVEEFTNYTKLHGEKFLRGEPVDENHERKYVSLYNANDSMTSTKDSQKIQRDVSTVKKNNESEERELRYAYDDSYGKKPQWERDKKLKQEEKMKLGQYRRSSLVAGMGNEFIKYGDQFLKAGDRYLNYKPGGLYSYHGKNQMEDLFADYKPEKSSTSF